MERALRPTGRISDVFGLLKRENGPSLSIDEIDGPAFGSAAANTPGGDTTKDQASDARNAARRFFEGITGRFPVTRAMLFGSHARGSAGPTSDVDVVVFLSGPSTSFVATKLALADAAYDVLLETGFHIQPLPVWEEEWAHPDTYFNPRLLRNIARDGQLL